MTQSSLGKIGWVLVVLAMAAVPACNCGSPASDPKSTVPGACEAEVPRIETVKTDILFVIDNSNSMGEEQTSLSTNFPNFINVLEGIEGGLPNVHLGVVSSNVGAGGQPISACTDDGDNGRLQGAPRIAGCTPPTGTCPSRRR